MRACSPSTLGPRSLEAARTFWRHQLVQQSHSEDSSGKAQRGVARAGRRLLRGAGSTVAGGGGRGNPTFGCLPWRRGSVSWPAGEGPRAPREQSRQLGGGGDGQESPGQGRAGKAPSCQGPFPLPESPGGGAGRLGWPSHGHVAARSRVTAGGRGVGGVGLAEARLPGSWGASSPRRGPAGGGGGWAGRGGREDFRGVAPRSLASWLAHPLSAERSLRHPHCRLQGAPRAGVGGPTPAVPGPGA